MNSPETQRSTVTASDSDLRSPGVLSFRHTVPGTVRTAVLGFDCNVRAHITEDIDVRTGDSIEHICIDEIIAVGSGQTILTNMLSVAQFRELVAQIRRQHLSL